MRVWNWGAQVQADELERYEAFWAANSYVAGAYDVRRDFELLNQELSQCERGPAANRLFYLALPPSVFQAVTATVRKVSVVGVGLVRLGKVRLG